MQDQPVTATAPGKIILFGEHAVVYGQPALAAPVQDIFAQATIKATPAHSKLSINAPDINLRLSLAEDMAHALAKTAKLVLEYLNRPEPDAEISIRSTIPIASGFGSGAAVASAVAQSLSQYLGQPLSKPHLSDLVYEIEKIHHGTPSGIDNTVICYNQPVYFVRGNAPETFHVAKPFSLLIADTGIPSPTKETVGAVRVAWQKNPEKFNALFESVGSITQQAREAIEAGDIAAIGGLMNQNQALLEQMSVSSPELNDLILAARNNGAAGAKLSGGGGGGNMLAFVTPEQIDTVTRALYAAGAKMVLHTRLN